MILGACSLCGGTVELPDKWYGIDPPRPSCRRCHATKKLAVIEMDAPRVTNTVFDQSSKASENIYSEAKKYKFEDCLIKKKSEGFEEDVREFRSNSYSMAEIKSTK